MVAHDPRNHLRQQEIRAAIGRPDPDLAFKLGRLAPHLVGGADHRGLGRLGMAQQPLARRGQRVALGRFGEQRRAQNTLQPFDPAAHGGRIATQPPGGAGQALRPRHGQEYPQVIPVELAFHT